MSSIQLKQMAEFYNEARSRFLNSNIGLATQRDVVERLHLAGAEPEGVSYAEVDTHGLPSLWCIPENCHKDHVLLHMHAGGSVVWSIHTDRKAVGHIAKAAGVDVTLRSLAEGQHNFLLGAGRVPEVDQAIQEMAQWLRSKLRLPEARN